MRKLLGEFLGGTSCAVSSKPPPCDKGYKLLGSFVLLVTFCLAMLFGSGSLSVEQVLSYFFSSQEQANRELVSTILLSIRLPRLLLAGLCGGVLSAAGVLSQGVFRNPLASPSVLGASAGGVFGAVCVFFLNSPWMHWYLLPGGAFLGCLVSMSLILGLVLIGVGRDVSRLLIAGFSMATFFGALTSLLTSLMLPDWEKASSLFHWMIGGFNGRGWLHLGTALPPALLGLGLAFFLVRRLDILSLGEDVARSLSIPIRSTQILCVVSVSLLVASAVSVAGALPFVGLIVPHISRNFTGPKHGKLLPLSIINGMTLIIAADFLCQIIASPVEIEVGSLTSLIGVIFFFAIFLRRDAYSFGGATLPSPPEATLPLEKTERLVSGSLIMCGEVKKGGRQILPRQSFEPTPGKLSAVLGRNGAGKSTLLKCLAGIEDDFAGEVRLLYGPTLSNLDLKKRFQHLSWCPAESSVAFPFSVVEIVVMGRFPLHQGRPGRKDFDAAHESLESIGISALGARNVLTLSSGELKKVMIARTLALQSPIVILDEPEAHLDFECSTKVLSELKSLTTKGRTIVVSLHNLFLARDFADECFILEHGELRRGDPFDLLPTA